VDFTTAQEALADPPVLVLFAAAHRDGRGLRGWLLGRIGARSLLVRSTPRPDGGIQPGKTVSDFAAERLAVP
jgi:hypothetical protein